MYGVLHKFPMNSQNTSYEGLIAYTWPNFNFLVISITNYILISLDTQENIIQHHQVGLGRYGVLHSSLLRNIRPRMLVTLSHCNNLSRGESFTLSYTHITLVKTYLL